MDNSSKLLATVALLSTIATASAQPAMAVIFGPNDMIVPVVVTLLAVGTFVVGRLFPWYAFGAGKMMSHEDHHRVDNIVKRATCSLMSPPGWFRAAVYFFGSVFLIVSLGGYTLHVFVDAADANLVPALPATFETWYTYVWTFTVGAMLFTKMALEFHAECQWHLLATISQFIGFLGFGAVIVFLILEFNLASTSGAVVPWEIVHCISVSLWTIVALLLAIRYMIITWKVGIMHAPDGGYEMLEQKDN